MALRHHHAPCIADTGVRLVIVTCRETREQAGVSEREREDRSGITAGLTTLQTIARLPGHFTQLTRVHFGSNCPTYCQRHVDGSAASA